MKEILKQIDRLQTGLVKKWHHAEPEAVSTGLLGLVENQHLQNFLLWHEEDIARDPNVGNDEIARVKRSIDKLNQKRNDLIEQIDEAIEAYLRDQSIVMPEAAAMNSETPGSMIDRCSIMSLKIFHMNEQTERQDVNSTHRQEAKAKLEVLEEQRRDLFLCLFQLMDEIAAGTRRFKIYRQFKMYNDPSLNPRIYGVQQK